MKKHNGKMKASNKGFSLIELMIVVAIVAILLAIAIPSYARYIRQTHRKAAMSEMENIAAYLESDKAKNLEYTNVAVANANAAGNFNGRYNIVVALSPAAAAAATGGQGFTITATATGPQAIDICGNLTLDSLGRKGFSDVNQTIITCW